MNQNNFRNHNFGRGQNNVLKLIILALLGILILAMLVLSAITWNKKSHNKALPADSSVASASSGSESETPLTVEETESEPSDEENLMSLLSQAETLATQYDYDGAINILKSDPKYADKNEVTSAITSYEAAKSALVRINPQDVTHIFFHSLIMDTSKAFDGDSKQAGYNQMMTTKSEFIKIMQSMYDKGYVLVKIHDLAYETKDENGNPKFVYGDIMLPEGKKAFVLSQDDLCYYEYMTGDGFATRMIVGDDGYPTCEMQMDDGSVSVGDYDLVPILESFIKTHPGFSYKGARGILAFTGYNGILGYRTDESYKDTNPNYEADREQAAKVAQSLKDHGWELASHSWGHRNMGQISMEHFKIDADKWEKNVEPLIGPTDIIIFPFGSDIGNWTPYKDDNTRYTYLKSLGFRYFCNVDASKTTWMQLGTDYFRQARRNLDGYRMFYSPDSLKDLFNVPDVFDPARPTPVPPMGSGSGTVSAG
ncbi:MAG: polysaccharide deacetylase [Lacrimispora sp.]